ncbi:MAG TPA: sigma-70 family RNA polymerase sigma factor [Polyangiaceae bacterium]|nr:sigma-70 family RNA polymerase sigma factor [Polyangiaceae bacterium]
MTAHEHAPAAGAPIEEQRFTSPAAGARVAGACDSADPGDVQARFHSALDLVEHNARQTARRLRFGDVTLDDLRSLASEGLLRASRSFDPSLGTPFRRWANRRIRDCLAEGLRQWAHLPRYRVHSDRLTTAAGDGSAKGSKDDLLERCIAMAVAEETMQAVDRQAEMDPERVASGRELLRRLREAIDRLPRGQRSLIERHDLGEESLPRVARALGISKSWATRLRIRALSAMACELQNGPRRKRCASESASRSRRRVASRG